MPWQGAVVQRRRWGGAGAGELEGLRLQRGSHSIPTVGVEQGKRMESKQGGPTCSLQPAHQLAFESPAQPVRFWPLLKQRATSWGLYVAGKRLSDTCERAARHPACSVLRSMLDELMVTQTMHGCLAGSQSERTRVANVEKFAASRFPAPAASH